MGGGPSRDGGAVRTRLQAFARAVQNRSRRRQRRGWPQVEAFGRRKGGAHATSEERVGGVELVARHVAERRGAELQGVVEAPALRATPPQAPLEHVVPHAMHREVHAEQDDLFLSGLLVRPPDLPESRARQVEGANLLKVRPEPDGDFSIQVRPDHPGALYLGFSHPDLVRFLEVGPVTATDLAAGTWDVALPRPADLRIMLDRKLDDAGRSPFGKGYFSLTPVIAGMPDSVPVLAGGTLDAPGWRAETRRLAPGAYNLHVQTSPREGPAMPEDGQASPGRFMELRKVVVGPGETRSVSFDPPMLDPQAWRGPISATVIVSAPGGRKLAGQDYRVWSMEANYGRIAVAAGKLGEDGRIALEGIRPSGADPAGGQYQVHAGGEYLGQFRVESRPTRQDFTLRMPPRDGDLAPSAKALEVGSGGPASLESFRGRVVFVEFWATWCGPCRDPRERLDALARRRSDGWKDDVALVAVGIDNDLDELRRQVRRSGSPGVRELWSPRDRPDCPTDAHAAYSISSVPTALLIDRDGRIAWRGHPSSIDVEARIEELRKQAR